jgi:hypothetical protein
MRVPTQSTVKSLIQTNPIWLCIGLFTVKLGQNGASVAPLLPQVQCALGETPAPE